MMILESEIDKWRKARGYTPAVGNEQLSEVQLVMVQLVATVHAWANRSRAMASWSRVTGDTRLAHG